eukprot:s3581_g5.t1
MPCDSRLRFKLAEVMAAFVAWTASSSGCEQMFSHLKRSPAELASSRQDTDRRLATIIGSDSQFDEEILRRGRQLYGQMLPSGRCRTSARQPRIDSGREGKQRVDSKKAWVRKRKAAVDAAAKEEAELRTPQRRPPVELPESLAKEVRKQDALLKKRKAEAFLEGTLVDSEITAEVRLEAEKRQKTDAANDKDRHKKFVRISTEVQLSQRPQTRQWALQGLPEPAYMLAAFPDGPMLKSVLGTAGVKTFSQDLKGAKLLIGPDNPETIGRAQRLAASLFGCVLLSASVLQGKGGYKMCFTEGVAQNVRIFLTDRFKAEAPGLTLVIREACSRGRGWKGVTLEEAKKKDGWKWGLVLRGKTEQMAAANSRCKHLLCLTGDELITWAAREFMRQTQSAWVSSKDLSSSVAMPILPSIRKTIGKAKKTEASFEPPPMAEITALAENWRKRLGPWKKASSKASLALGSDCSGYGSEMLALRLMGLQARVKCRMRCEASEVKLCFHSLMSKLCGMNCTDCQEYKDMFERDDAGAPRLDLYCAGYPCPSFSRMGCRRGTKDKRGLITLQGMRYIASARPRALVLEQVSAIMDKTHKQVWHFVQKILTMLEYEFVFKVLNTRHYGIPQSRPRVYLMAVCKESVVKPLVLPPQRESHPDLHTFLNKDLLGNETLSLPHYESKLGPMLWTRGFVLDVAASTRYQHALTNCSPCLTKTRCKQHGYYIPKLKRRLTPAEMGRLQGLPSFVVERFLQENDLPQRAFEEAVGDAMSVAMAADEDDRRDPRRRGDADGVPEGTEPHPGDGPPPTEAPGSERPNSPAGRPPPRRESSSNSRGGLGRDARSKLDENPRHRREDGADRDRRRRSGGDHGDAERGRRHHRSPRERKETGREDRESHSHSRFAHPPPASPFGSDGTSYCQHCRTTVKGGQCGFDNHCRGKYHRAAVYYNFGYGLPWTRPRSRVALTEVPEPPDPPRAASSHAAGRRKDKEEDRRRDAKNEGAILKAAKASEGDRRADRGAASKKRSAPSKASTEVKKEDPPKEKTKPKKEATSSDSYEEVEEEKKTGSSDSSESSSSDTKKKSSGKSGKEAAPKNKKSQPAKEKKAVPKKVANPPQAKAKAQSSHDAVAQLFEAQAAVMRSLGSWQ